MGLLGVFSVYNRGILVLLKFSNGISAFSSLGLVSRPGNRVFWSLAHLRLLTQAQNFAGFYLLSTTQGVITSNECLLVSFITGEVVLKVEM